MHVGVPAPPLLPDPAAFCPVLSAEGSAWEQPQPCSSFLLAGLVLFSRVDGTEAHAALYSDLVCPARPFPCRTHTHTYTSVLGTQSSVHAFPWPVPPTQHLRGPECSNLIHSISWKGEGKTAPGVTLPCPGTILEHAWLLKHKVFFAFLSLGCLRRGWRETRACPALAPFLCKVCPELFSRPGEMSCRFGYELTVLLLFGREVTLYIQSCIIKERNLICFPSLLSATHTHTHLVLLFQTSFFSLSKPQLCPQESSVSKVCPTALSKTSVFTGVLGFSPGGLEISLMQESRGQIQAFNLWTLHWSSS